MLVGARSSLVDEQRQRWTRSASRHCNMMGHLISGKESTFTSPNTTTQGTHSLSLAAPWPSSACLEIPLLLCESLTSAAVGHSHAGLCWQRRSCHKPCRAGSSAARAGAMLLSPHCHPLPRRAEPREHNSPVTSLEASGQTHCLVWKGKLLCARYLCCEAETTYQSIELHSGTKTYSGFPKTSIFPFGAHPSSPLVKLRFPQISGPQGSLGRVAVLTKLQTPGRSGSRAMVHAQDCSQLILMSRSPRMPAQTAGTHSAVLLLPGHRQPLPWPYHINKLRMAHGPAFGLDVFTVVQETSNNHMALQRQQGAIQRLHISAKRHFRVYVHPCKSVLLTHFSS